MLKYIIGIVFAVWLCKAILHARVQQTRIRAEQQTRIALAKEETRRLEILKGLK